VEQPNNLVNRENSSEWKKKKNKTFRNAQNFDNQILQKVKKEREKERERLKERERKRERERERERENESEKGKKREKERERERGGEREFCDKANSLIKTFCIQCNFALKLDKS
jgi:hypothetical protein